MFYTFDDIMKSLFSPISIDQYGQNGEYQYYLLCDIYYLIKIFSYVTLFLVPFANVCFAIKYLHCFVVTTT